MGLMNRMTERLAGVSDRLDHLYRRRRGSGDDAEGSESEGEGAEEQGSEQESGGDEGTGDGSE